MSKKNSDTKTVATPKINQVDIFKKNGLTDGMGFDMFTALALAFLRDSWLSGDTKVLTFYAMIGNLKKMGYSPEDIEKFRLATNELVATFHVPNEFMG